jgi:hypothetical protein
MSSTGNVGIGTAAPLAKLHVQGTGLFAGLVGIGTSSPGALLDVKSGSLHVGSEYVSTLNTDYRIRLRSVGAATNNNYMVELGASGSGPQPADSDLTINTQTWNGSAYVVTEKMRVTATGRVGIGTTGPSAKLEVAGGNIRVDNNQGIEWGGVNNYIYGNESTDFIAIATNGTERARIDSSGRLLMGTSTARTNNSEIVTTDGNVAFVNDDAYSTSLSRKITYYSSTSSYGVQPLADIVFATEGDAASSLRFLTRNDPVDYSERARIDSSGRLLVGTSEPLTSTANTLLQVAGSISTNGSQSGPAYIYANGGGDNSSLNIRAGSTAGVWSQIEVTGNWNGTANTGGKVAMFTGGTERMRIGTSGNVGIGTNNPVAPLDVNGKVNITLPTSLSTTLDAGISFTNTSTKTYPTSPFFSVVTGLSENIEIGNSVSLASGFNFVAGNSLRFTKSAGNTQDINSLSYTVLSNSLVWNDLNTCNSYTGISNAFNYAGINANSRTSSQFTGQFNQINLNCPDAQTQTVDTVLPYSDYFAITPAGSSTVNITTSFGQSLSMFNSTAGTKTINIGTHTFLSTFYNGWGMSSFGTPGTMTANITTMYGLRLRPPSIGSGNTLNVTNNWGIYQEWGNSQNYFAGNVGIGTTNPTGKLDVNGVVNASNFISSSYSAFGSVVAADPGSGYYGWNNRIGGGLAVVGTFYTDGTVGIGTTSPAENLHIHNPNTSLAVIRLSGSAASQTPFNIRQGIVGTNNGGFSIYDVNNSATRFAIDPSGNIGIGLGSPSEKLEVNGRTVLTTGTAPFYGLKVKDYSNTTGVYVGSVSAGSAWYIGDSYYYNSGLWRTDKTHASSINFINGSLEFYTNTGLTAGVDYTPSRKMILDSSGNLLIGTSSATGTASQPLQVSGGAYISGSLGIGVADPYSAYKLHVAGELGVGQGGFSQQLHISNNGIQSLLLGTGYTNLLLNSLGGNIGIGTTNPTYKLHVNGSFAATTKSFVIPHPTKEGYRLRHGSLEGPENGVYVRGRSTGSVIELPEYWTGLVDPDSITVNLTPIGQNSPLWVERIEDNKVYVGREDAKASYFYAVFAERADVPALDVEIKIQEEDE